MQTQQKKSRGVPSRMWWLGKALEGVGIVAAYFSILVVLSYPVVTAMA